MVDRHLLIALYVMVPPVLVSALEPFANVTSDRPGVIQGTLISRADGSAVPNAEVIALSEHTFTTHTDASGMFSFVNLPLGAYEVTVIPEWHEWWFGTCTLTRASLTVGGAALSSA